MDDLDAVYAQRFTDRETAAKERVWREITRYLQRWFPADGSVLDMACDRGDFVRNVRAGERWACDIRDVSSLLPPDVRFVQADARSLRGVLPPGSFDAIFISNYLEHLPSSDAVIEQLQVCAGLLRRGGRVVVLQPNIRHTGAAYWDFIDHRTPLTERSLEEAASIAGFRTVKLIARFLPYTTKSRIPRHPLLVRGYLAVPVAWRLLGRQALYVGERG